MHLEMVSIVVPCYKSELYISDVLDDVKHQTYDNWELIIVGNGSDQDAQRGIAESAMKNDFRMRYVSLKEKGVSKARNKGIEVSHGKWIAFVDADDRLPPNWIEGMLLHASANPDLVVGGVTYKDVYTGKRKRVDLTMDNGELFSRSPTEFMPLFTSDMATTYSPCAKLYKASFLKELNLRFCEGITIYEDGIFNLQAALRCDSMCLIPQTGYVYCLHPNTSAIGRYHPCLEQAGVMRRELMHQVLKRGCFGGIEIERRMASMIACDALDAILNLFRAGTTFGFFSKRKKLKELYKDCKLINAWKVFTPPISNIPLVLFRIFHAMHAPTLCLIAFHFLFFARKFWRKINAFARYS